jgi:hypothetical protein
MTLASYLGMFVAYVFVEQNMCCARGQGDLSGDSDAKLGDAVSSLGGVDWSPPAKGALCLVPFKCAFDCFDLMYPLQLPHSKWWLFVMVHIIVVHMRYGD